MDDGGDDGMQLWRGAVPCRVGGRRKWASVGQKEGEAGGVGGGGMRSVRDGLCYGMSTMPNKGP